MIGMEFVSNRNASCIILVLFLELPAFLCGGGRCLGSWHLNNGYCYEYFPEEKNQEAAKEACKALGGDEAYLLSVKSEQEYNFTLQLMSDKNDAWIGLERNSYKEWRWLDNTTIDQFNKWASEEPSEAEYCARIKSDGFWYGIGCTSLHSLVCKKDAIKDSSSSTTKTQTTTSATITTTIETTATTMMTSPRATAVHATTTPKPSTTSAEIEKPTLSSISTINTIPASRGITTVTDAGNIESTNNEQDKVLIYAVAGGVVGFVIIVIIIAVLVYMRRTRRNEKPEEGADEEPTQHGDDALRPVSQVQVNVMVNVNPSKSYEDIDMNYDRHQSDPYQNGDMMYSEPQIANKEPVSKPVMVNNKPQSKATVGKKAMLPPQASPVRGVDKEEHDEEGNEENMDDLYAKPMKKKPIQTVPEVTLVENQIYNS